MAVKDWITQGIGADPGSLLYWLNGGLGSEAPVVPDIPIAVYTITVPAQPRTMRVAAQSRVVTVAAQLRTITVPAQPWVSVPRQRRTIVVRKPRS